MVRLITHSELSCLFLCPKKHEFQYKRRLVPNRPVVFLDESIAGHEALETFYKGGTIEESLASFDDVYNRHIKALQDLNYSTENDTIRFLRMRALTLVYLENVGMKDRKEYTFDHVEAEFNVPIYDLKGNELPGVRFAGKMDGIWTGKMGRKLKKVVEHKFLAEFDESKNTLMIDQQVTLYSLAARYQYGVETPITMYNVCRKPRHRLKKDKKTKKEETTDEFYNRVIEAVEKDKSGYFSRVPVTRGPEDFREAKRLLYYGAMMLTGEIPMPLTYRNIGKHCTMLCGYRNICPPNTPDSMINAMFKSKRKLHSELSFKED